mmetsp:Transcript_688/g.2004  ORF Transcript_688/g.2004 Transcript_688/m.2004 type:complete len:175 (+) Transcript_688:1176-1700(+)
MAEADLAPHPPPDPAPAGSEAASATDSDSTGASDDGFAAFKQAVEQDLRLQRAVFLRNLMSEIDTFKATWAEEREGKGPPQPSDRDIVKERWQRGEPFPSTPEDSEFCWGWLQQKDNSPEEVLLQPGELSDAIWQQLDLTAYPGLEETWASLPRGEEMKQLDQYLNLVRRRFPD